MYTVLINSSIKEGAMNKILKTKDLHHLYHLQACLTHGEWGVGGGGRGLRSIVIDVLGVKYINIEVIL